MRFRAVFVCLQMAAVVWTVSAVGAEKETTPASPWTKELLGRLNVSQVSFTNWAKGGENAWSYTSNLSGKIQRETKRFLWFVRGDFAFGQSMIGGEKVRNTKDRLEMEFNATWKESRYLNPYISAMLLTQFARGYDYRKDPPVPKSDFWDPAYLTQSAGFGYRLNEIFSTQVGMAVKTTFTRNFRKYSDNPRTPHIQETRKIEPGVKSESNLLLKINSNLRLECKLVLFSDLKAVRAVDVRWENKLDAKVAKFVAVNLELDALYDRDMTKLWQWKQFLGIGLSYSFF